MNASAAAPFTPEGVRVLLIDKVLKSEMAPTPNDPALIALSRGLNSYRFKATTGAEFFRPNAERREQLASALITINAVLPGLREEMELVVATSGDWQPPQAIEARAALAALAKLAEGSAAVGHCAILLHHALRDPAGGRWELYARPLATLFHQSLPAATKESAYRFIAEVSPMVTGELRIVTPEAVKTLLKRNRPVNKGK